MNNNNNNKVISLQGLDLKQVSNETAEKLIEALDQGANFDQESMIKLVRLQLTPGPLARTH